MQFREDQKPIMEYRGGTMAVPAVPGAGKTFIVAHLAAKIIEEKLHKPGKVLVVTYMNSAVNNFKSRISSVLENKGIAVNGDYEVMTIHSLAMKILKERPDVVGVNEEFQIIDDMKKIAFLNECIENWRRKNGERIFRFLLSDSGNRKYNEKSEYYWRDFFNIADSLISELKLNSISPELLLEKLENVEEISIVKSIFEVYDAYVKKIRMEGYIDYNDLLLLAYKALLLDGKLREKFKNKYSFIFEDECQDSNLVQSNILLLLSENNNNLVRVGDLNQSIMGTFTSSDPKFFANFCSQAERKHIMNVAGRSSMEIISLANYLVSYVRTEHLEEKCRGALEEQYIKMMAGMEGFKNPEPEDYGIYSYCYSSWDKVKETTLKAVKNFKIKNPDKTIGILVPYNNQVTELAKELRRIGIECDELSTTSEKRIKITNILGYMLRFLSEPDDIIRFKELMNCLIDENLPGKELLIGRITSYEIEDLLENKIKDLYENQFSNGEKLISKELIELFKKYLDIMKELLIHNEMSMGRLILYIGNLLNLNINDKAMVETVASYVQYEQKYKVDLTLEEVSQRLLDVKNSVFKQIADVIYEIQGYEPTPERVTISTCHKSKGLEWDCVFLLSLTDYNFPSSLRVKIRSDHYYFKEEFKNPIALGKAEMQKY
ncbi:ATP-dependent helicase [Clostridium sp. OS1-26]|uniref:ATP-dependent helicase n=1 Tax=Clostridium sp. OS1-26 TaxID=3070681 RepID=UPI0027E17806|nr:ATP-dependent helicase [Clostridium sp. OS1-26]WML37247.1 ATP-dependent helicase [Clostridium sp. OS1-26]